MRRPTHRIHSIILIILMGSGIYEAFQYEFAGSPVLSSLLCPDMLPSNPFSDNLNLYRDTMHLVGGWKCFRGTYCLHLQGRWRQKFGYSSTMLHSVESHKTTWIFTAEKMWNFSLNLCSSLNVRDQIQPHNFSCTLVIPHMEKWCKSGPYWLYFQCCRHIFIFLAVMFSEKFVNFDLR
jgi:hypothetical protein